MFGGGRVLRRFKAMTHWFISELNKLEWDALCFPVPAHNRIPALSTCAVDLFQALACCPELKLAFPQITTLKDSGQYHGVSVKWTYQSRGREHIFPFGYTELYG